MEVDVAPIKGIYIYIYLNYNTASGTVYFARQDPLTKKCSYRRRHRKNESYADRYPVLTFRVMANRRVLAHFSVPKLVPFSL